MSCNGAIGVVPPTCPIASGGGTSKHELINQCALKLAFKIRSSNNSNYSVNVIGGVLDVAEKKEFVITRKPGKPQKDKLVIQFCDYRSGVAPLDHFNGTPQGEVVGETIIKLSAAE